jgi:hypothetical protein
MFIHGHSTSGSWSLTEESQVQGRRHAVRNCRRAEVHGRRRRGGEREGHGLPNLPCRTPKFRQPVVAVPVDELSVFVTLSALPRRRARLIGSSQLGVQRGDAPPVVVAEKLA